jgi:hypothetical protein
MVGVQGAARIATLAALVMAAAALHSALAAEVADALTISPLNGTPDASPRTQISFVGVSASDIKGVSVVGSRSGRHSGRLRSYASAPGASFLPNKPFVAGERVTAAAVLAGSRRGASVRTSFTIAHPASYPHYPMEPPPTAKPGTVQSFVTAPSLHPPTVQVRTSSLSEEIGDVFISPNHGAGQWGPMIIDGAGQLVWFQPTPPGSTAMNLQVQRYEGQPVLVWWQGYLSRLGFGLGVNEIYNTSYQPVARVSAGNGYSADLHDIQITPRGSAFITAYSFVHANLSEGGGVRQGVLLDSILQEIDIKTGLVMFEWHPYGHIPLSDSYSSPGAPWDYFHLNSVDPDPWGDGNFIISSRNTWAAYEISYHTGAVLWRLGGKHSTFKMGPGTGTAWQHDVRWQPNRTLTLFDNGSAPKIHSQSRQVHLRLDWKRRAASIIDRHVHTPALLSGSQGDSDTLPDGDTFIGWGEQPYITEFSPSGEVVFDARFPAPGQSYRAYRVPWSATPAGPPSIAVRTTAPGTNTVYASWNGATAVHSWRVLSGDGAGALAPITDAPRNGFETAISVPAAHAWFAVQALGPGGQVLGTSQPAHT